MGCQPIEGAYDLYLVGALSERERTEIGAHVESGCPRCVGELREAAETLYWLAQSIPAARPSPAVKSRLLRGLTARADKPNGGNPRRTDLQE